MADDGPNPPAPRKLAVRLTEHTPFPAQPLTLEERSAQSMLVNGGQRLGPIQH